MYSNAYINRKQKGKLILAVLFFFTTVIAAQTPGYMGKHCSAGYGFNASPGFIGSGGNTVLNMLHEGYLEYAVAKKVSIGFSAKFYNAVYSNSRDVRINENYYSTSENQIDGHPSGTTAIKGTNYALYAKFFKKNYLAPWGKYVMIGATVNTFRSSYDPNEMGVHMSKYSGYPTYDYKYSYYSSFGPTEQSFVKFDVLLGMGRSRIIANRIILDYGFNANFLGMLLTLFDAGDDGFVTNTRLYPYNYIETTSAARVRGVNRFNVFFKAGVLLF